MSSSPYKYPNPLSEPERTRRAAPHPILPPLPVALSILSFLSFVAANILILVAALGGGGGERQAATALFVVSLASLAGALGLTVFLVARYGRSHLVLLVPVALAALPWLILVRGMM